MLDKYFLRRWTRNAWWQTVLVVLAAPAAAMAGESTAAASRSTGPAATQPLPAPHATPAAAPEAAPSERKERVRLDAGLTFSHFQQQVKTEVGGARGARLVEETAFGLGIYGTYRIWGPFALGLFTQLDAGSRHAGQFAGFDSSGATVISPSVGGNYLEFWAGPMLRVQWRTLFAEAGYGALGIRQDSAREDLRNDAGENAGLFAVLPSVAWVIDAGGGVPVMDTLQVVLRVEYRVRYYHRRGGEPLENAMVHGTQNVTPFVGVAWTP